MNGSIPTGVPMILFSSRGQALVQLMVGVAVITIMVSGMTSMLVSAHREARAVSEKLTALDLEKVLTSSLADGSVCTYVLNNPAPLTFKSNAQFPQTITLPSPGGGQKPALYSTILPGSVPGPKIAEVGSTISSSSSAKVGSIQLQVTEGSAGSYKANWLVNFDGATLVRGLKPVSVPVQLRADISNPAQAKVTGCSGEGSGASGVTYYNMYWDNDACRSSPSTFSNSAEGAWASAGDISTIPGMLYSSMLFEMRVRASVPTTVTQQLRYIGGRAYFWLNGTKIAEETSPGPKNRTISWNLVAGENLVQVIANTCGGGQGFNLGGDFFVSHPELQFIP